MLYLICDSDVVERSLNLVFDDVLTTELRGSIPQPEAVLKMFFREPRSRRGAVTFTSLRVEAAIALVNLQNVAHLTVDPDSRFRRVDNLEIIQRSVDTKVRGTGSTKLYIRHALMFDNVVQYLEKTQKLFTFIKDTTYFKQVLSPLENGCF